MSKKTMLFALLAVPLMWACDKPQSSSTAEAPPAAAKSDQSGMGGPAYPAAPGNDPRDATPPPSDTGNAPDAQAPAATDKAPGEGGATSSQ